MGQPSAVRASEPFEERLRDWGFNRAQGDALLLVTELERACSGLNMYRRVAKLNPDDGPIRHRVPAACVA